MRTFSTSPTHLCSPRGVTAADLACAWADLHDRGLPVPSWAVARRLAEAGGAAALVLS